MQNQANFDEKPLPQVGHTLKADTGVGCVKAVANGDVGYIFRETPTADFGIDGQLEIVATDYKNRKFATGKIISAQIKTGFDSESSDAWTIYIRKETMNYWMAHSVPVIFIWVDTATGQCYWTRADTILHKETDKGFAVRVPKNQPLDASARTALAEIAENVTPAGRRQARLEGDAMYMRMLQAGESVSVNVVDWVNKSSGRKTVSVGHYVSDTGYAKFETLFEFWTIGWNEPKEMVEQLFPWALVQPDEKLRPSEDALYDRYLEEEGRWDSEEGEYVDIYGEFDSWRQRQSFYDGFYDADEEVAHYRFSLELNDLGRAFLTVHEFLQHDT